MMSASAVSPELRGIYECRIIGKSEGYPHMEGRVGGFIRRPLDNGKLLRTFVVLDDCELDALGLKKGDLPIDMDGDAVKNGVYEAFIRDAHQTDDEEALVDIKRQIAARAEKLLGDPDGLKKKMGVQ
jgi:hypothetical protein